MIRIRDQLFYIVRSGTARSIFEKIDVRINFEPILNIYLLYGEGYVKVGYIPLLFAAPTTKAGEEYGEEKRRARQEPPRHIFLLIGN